jgi:hypothetical protein
MQTRLSPLTLALAALLLVHAVVITAALHFLLDVPRVDTLAHQVDVLLTGTPGGDSWKPMATAARFASEQPGASIYDEIFVRRQMKFQYPPSALLFTAAFGRQTLHWLSWFAVWLTVALTAFIFDRSLRAAGFAPAGRADAIVRLAITAGLAASFYPLIKAYSLGQIQTWIDALFAVMVVAWARRPAAGGACLGLICLIKPHFAMIALWAVLRRQWRFAAASAAVVLVGVALSIAVYGLQSHVDYLRTLAFIGERGEAFYANQSFNGLFNRWFFNGVNLEWQETSFAPLNSTVLICTAAAASIVVAAALFAPRRQAQGSLTDLAIAGLTATVASPIAWEHHYGVLLPLLAATAGDVLRRRPLGGLTAAALALVFVLTGQFFQPFQHLAATRLNVLQSYVLLGGLLLIALWHRVARAQGTRLHVVTAETADIGPANVLP